MFLNISHVAFDNKCKPLETRKIIEESQVDIRKENNTKQLQQTLDSRAFLALFANCDNLVK